MIAFIVAAATLVIGPLWDYWIHEKTVYTDFHWSTPAFNMVAGTCALAVAVNAATFFLLGKTSPVSYQVVGHLKTVLVLGGGWGSLFLYYITTPVRAYVVLGGPNSDHQQTGNVSTRNASSDILTIYSILSQDSQ